MRDWGTGEMKASFRVSWPLGLDRIVGSHISHRIAMSCLRYDCAASIRNRGKLLRPVEIENSETAVGMGKRLGDGPSPSTVTVHRHRPRHEKIGEYKRDGDPHAWEWAPLCALRPAASHPRRIHDASTTTWIASDQHEMDHTGHIHIQSGVTFICSRVSHVYT